MPIAPPRACARCNQPAQHGKPCQCRPAFEGSTHPGGDKRWTKLRATKLRTNPMCQHPGCRHLATEVDHIRPLAEDGPKYDWHNCQSLCATHHSMKTTADARRGKTRLR